MRAKPGEVYELVSVGKVGVLHDVFLRETLPGPYRTLPLRAISLVQEHDERQFCWLQVGK